MRPIIAILGPTATGKTEVGVLVAQAIDGEIISCDSMAVYRGMDIGTAKPTSAERSAARFHLLDVVDPNERYNAAAFKLQASEALDGIAARGRWPLLVGGTGLYARVLLEDFGLTRTAGDPSIRSGFEREADESGIASLYSRLRSVDPVSAGRIHLNDRVRIIRALEVFVATGQPLSQQQADDAASRSRRPSIKFALSAPREELNRRIDARVDKMIELGLVLEVARLLELGFGPDVPALRSLGYKEIASHLREEISLEEAVEEIKRNTRRFAKRQLTWFRADRELVWIDVSGRTASETAIEIVQNLPR